ncbi:MAG: ACT domain-containing protein [Clostridiales bacterium]|nr:ACT domain-containing protein [Clostridiales bacterium]
MKLKLKIIEGSFSICKVSNINDIDLDEKFTFVSVTDEEISLVCKTENIEEMNIETTKRDDGWKAFRIEGVLDFSLLGIIAHISKILAENKIGIFVVSTYNTDYVFVKEKSFNKAIKVLNENKYIV